MNPMLAAIRAELWAMEPAALERFAAVIASATPDSYRAAMEMEQEADAGPGYSVSGGVATIGVHGPLMKSVPMIMKFFGMEATGYLDVQRALAAADADPAVEQVLMSIDSPGGTVAGIHAMTDAIAAVGKPVTAHITDLGASAAYWMASQADRVTASRGAGVGSIGVYRVAVDSSQAAAAEGVKVKVISSGPYKGAGVPGAPITAEQEADMQADVMKMADEFISEVAAGRGKSPEDIRASADGRVFSASEASARGLIDEVTSDPMKEFKMTKSIEQMAALIKAHTAHALLIADLAVADKSEEDILAAIGAVEAKAVADAAAAAEAARIVKLEAAAAAAAAITERAEAAEKALAEERAANAALKALQEGAAAALAVKADGEASESKKVSRAEYDKDPSAFARGLRDGSITLVG